MPDQNTIATPAAEKTILARRRTIGLAMVVISAVAVFLDVPLSDWAHRMGWSVWLNNHRWITDNILRLPGRPLGVVIAIIIAILSTKAHVVRNSAIVALSALLSGSNAFFKWAIGRIRPFHGVAPFHFQPFKGGFHGQMMAEQNLSFPSGDATLAFALAASLAMVVPRARALWWSLGIFVACERIAQGAHYPSDTVGGAVLGVACALLARRIVQYTEIQLKHRRDARVQPNNQRNMPDE